MSDNNFLRDYTIPMTKNFSVCETQVEEINKVTPSNYTGGNELKQPPAPPLALLNFAYDFNNCDNNSSTSVPYSAQTVSYAEYEIPNRYMPPGKFGKEYRTASARPLKRKFNNNTTSVKGANIIEETSDGQLVMFQGRDATYPEELNKLIHPLKCDLCKTQMNSLHSAKDHFDSKAHGKNINAWLVKNSNEKGLEPPAVKRFIKEGATGPEAYHCDLCDLKLTSVMHAKQHFAGRKHKLVANNVSKPSGAGYYNTDGKWIRTATKLVPTTTDGRFGIGEAFKIDADVVMNEVPKNDICSVVVNTNDKKNIVNDKVAMEFDETANGIKKSIVDGNHLHCQICSVHVTSVSQMAMHIQGAKHRKKMLSLGQISNVLPANGLTEEINDDVKTLLGLLLEQATKNTISEDLSMYRTPTGSYYCKDCNTTMCHVQALQQHLAGKKHLKKLYEVSKQANKNVVN